MNPQVRLFPLQPSAVLQALERKHPEATILNRAEPTISCQLCLTRADGTMRPGPKYKEMSRGTLLGHIESRHHRRQLTDHNLPHGSMVGLIPGPILQTWVMRCEACCLDPLGEFREKYSSMDESTALAHFASQDHERRLADGRLAKHAELHPAEQSDQSEEDDM